MCRIQRAGQMKVSIAAGPEGMPSGVCLRRRATFLHSTRLTDPELVDEQVPVGVIAP
jgi:hypothetical protein